MTLNFFIDTLIWVFQYILPPLLTFLLGRYLERTSNKKNHDKNIFLEIEKILNDKDFMNIIENNPGYLPPNTFSKCDSLNFFEKTPGKQFIDKELNNKFSAFCLSFLELNNFYSMSSYGGYVGDGHTYKLILEKKGNNKEKELLKKSLELGKIAENQYRCFRSLVKQKLYI